MKVSAGSSSLQKISFIGGSQPLWKAFWVLYVIGSLSFTAISVLLIKAISESHVLLKISDTLNLQAETTLVIIVAAIVVVYIVYFLFCFLSVLRCSINTVKKYWAILAKSVVSINLGWISWKVFVAFSSLVAYFSHQ